MKNDYELAIELGKKWMKDSVDPLHDYNHALEVERRGIEICKNVRIKNKEFVSLFKVCAWWHDSYISRFNKYNPIRNIIEGKESEKILRKELKGILDEKSINSIARAVYRHNQSPLTLYFSKRFKGLTRILIEADNLEVFNDKRLKRKFQKYSSILYIFVKIYRWYVREFYKILPMHEYTVDKIELFKEINGR